ncbi:hypothetical protein [Paenibacillus sp. Cedars]|uniref:hypothetical protein n=1 Tax=Paenibacillus sp. Cedars TaxID=1980674 RepID=UPI0011623E7E|nr:hypothetical protein [Paenibacillus sp. Cedars]AWP28722.1 hypothetical protein B9D94_19740 [Paenibacillus sp. Cedars]
MNKDVCTDVDIIPIVREELGLDIVGAVHFRWCWDVKEGEIAEIDHIPIALTADLDHQRTLTFLERLGVLTPAIIRAELVMCPDEPPIVQLWQYLIKD